MMNLAESMIFSDVNRIFFSNAFELNHYQSRMLRRLCRKLEIEDLSATYSPREGLDLPFVTLKTSGTTSNIIKHRSFPEYLYPTIQQYHTERTIVFNDWSFGPIVVLRQRENNHQKVLSGPFDTIAFGPRCPLWFLTYDTFYGDIDFWTQAMDAVQKLKPVYLYGRPNEMFMISQLLQDKYDFPVVCAGETLYPHVRQLIENVFVRAVDEMRCWDGGLTFFECAHGRKHILDELCLVEQEGDNLLVTDFFNYTEPYLRYCNYDRGDFDIGQCGCGIFGRYFSFFYGKTIENILRSDGVLISGSAMAHSLFQELKQDIPFKVHQRKSGEVVLYLGEEISPSERYEVGKVMYMTINAENSTPFDLRIAQHDFEPTTHKQLLVTSDLVRDAFYK